MTGDDILTYEKLMNSEELRIVKQLAKAKEIIKDLLSVLPKENIEGVYEVTEEAEQFLIEVAEPSSAEIDPPVAWCEIPKYTDKE